MQRNLGGRQSSGLHTCSMKGMAATSASMHPVLRAALFARTQCNQSTETSCPAARRAAKQSFLRKEPDTTANIDSKDVQQFKKWTAHWYRRSAAGAPVSTGHAIADRPTNLFDSTAAIGPHCKFPTASLYMLIAPYTGRSAAVRRSGCDAFANGG